MFYICFYKFYISFYRFFPVPVPVPFLFDGMCPVSRVLCCMLHPMSSILHPATPSCCLHPASSVLRPPSCILPCPVLSCIW